MVKISGKPGLLLAGLLILTAGLNCGYVLDLVGYVTNESYISGKETQYRLETAAWIGFAVRFNADPANANPAAPVVSILAARIKKDRKYLESTVESCEETLILSNAAGLDITGQLLTGLICNLGPGRDPNEI